MNLWTLKLVIVTITTSVSQFKLDPIQNPQTNAVDFVHLTKRERVIQKCKTELKVDVEFL